MTTALYKQICENDSYKEKVKYIIEFDDVIDHLISKDIINEAEYMNIWNEGEGKLNTLFDTLSFKSNSILGKCFEVFKDIYGAEFERILKEINQDIIDYVHLRGRLPKISRYIPRLEEEAKLKEKFANIRWNNSLVVYGRVGEGKSYLVSQCLQDEELIWENFDNRLFWINVGDFENGSDIQQPLARLLQMLVQKQRKVYNIEELVEELQKLFSTEKPRKSLVILDNARSLELIETFQNIRCKLIITTHYKTVKHAEFLKVDSGFTLSETVSLFAQYLGTSCEKLNNFFSDDIKDIHELCKGHPSTLALIGDILSCKREYALTSRNLWEYIKEKIDKGEIEDLGNDDTCTTGRNFNRALKMCIDTIRTDEMKELYYQLSVFPKEANISTEVLEVFWGKNSWEVQDIMLHFENRSLINCFYNPNKKGYVYVIHDLFLYYLKNQTKAQKKKFHQKLITSYENKYEFNMLPDDNYILLFLGYHLKQADLIDKFEAFLDLKFMEHKIKLVGVSNLEHDFKTYGNEIINDDPERRSKLEKCLEFIKENKNELRQLQKTDIVQLALPTLKDDAQMLMVQNEANSINRLYFTIKFSAGRLKSSQEIFMDKEVTSMAFCTDSNVSKILIGLKNGDIVLYCSQNHKEFDRFQGHKQPVFDLKIAHDNTCFLSVSQDHTVKLWNFFSQRSSIDGIDLPTSPKCVQSEYYHVFNSGKRNNFKEFIYNEDNDYLVSANFANNYSVIKKICTGTNNGKVILWNAYTREKLFITTETGFPVENIYFSHDDSGVLFTKQEKIQIYKYENEELAYSGSISNMEDIVKFFMSNENTVISVGLRHVMMYKQPYESNPIKVYDSPDYNITCSAVAKGEYFAIGVRETVFLFSIASGQLVETLKHNKIVTSISMDIAKDDDNITSMILMNFDDNNIQQCNLMMQHYTQPRNKHGLVTTYWKNKNTPLLAFVSNDNILKIQHEFNTINEIEKPHKISFITFSLCGNNIIFSSENGEIVEYQYKRQGCFKILMELRSTVKYLKCFESGLPIGNSVTSNYSSSDSDNGDIVAITEGDKKIHVLLSDGHLNKFSWDIPIFHVFPIASRKLLCIDESGGIFIITLKDEKIVQLVIYATCYRKVTSAAYCLKNNLVAITFIKQNFKTNYLEITDITTKEILQNLFLDFVPECCAFSHQGDLLVLGGEDGKIMICNIRDNFRKIFLSNAGSPIKFLQFSQSELPILVTVGKEISWWNLSNFQFDSKEISTLYNNDFDLVFWKNKTFHKEIDYLLQTVTLYSNAVHFSVSKNFETFLVVDDESRIYVLKCFKNVQ